ncbi:unnamed protein product [Parnassius apollo]|uniref:(apollo) hypothetical protein n=1 Tax=Parnassius apollo TaxID=110799 RepID=A0A8S3Y5U6_PARAO|nr:unnamed protein product [Parnassius apollo]
MMNQSLQSLLSEYSHIGHLFVDCMRRNPDFTCQIDAATGQEETNASVLSRSIRLAQALRKFGLRPGDVLALGGNNHLDLHIPYYAALLNGYPIAGVDPLFKYSELRSLFKITQPKIAFCQRTSLEEYERAAHDLGLDMKIVTFEEGEGSMKELLSTYDIIEPEAEFKIAKFDVDKVYAFLISTSGTTGFPKVAAFKHRITMEKFLTFMKYSNKMSTIGLNLSPVQWISGIFNAVAMPISSQTKVQTSRPDDIDHLIEMINKYKPPSMFMSPALMLVLLRRWDEVDLSCLKEILITGAKTNVAAINELRGRLHKNTNIKEAYGMTETLGPVLTPNVNGPVGSCGKPTHGYAIKLVDPDTGSEIKEPYQNGELLAKGLCFTEYLGNPEETRKSFTEDGYFKTGDLLYRDEKDNYFFVDRIKMLIKFRNVHVVPSELEEVILQHHGVLDVCVTSIPHPDDDEHPVACVIRKPDSIVTAQEIKELVSNHLSKNKVLCGGVVFVDKLPMTSSDFSTKAKSCWIYFEQLTYFVFEILTKMLKTVFILAIVAMLVGESIQQGGGGQGGMGGGPPPKFGGMYTF